MRAKTILVVSSLMITALLITLFLRQSAHFIYIDKKDSIKPSHRWRFSSKVNLIFSQIP